MAVPLSFFIPPEGVARQGHLGQRVIVALETDGLRMTYLTDNLDAGPRLTDTEAFTAQDLLIALRVQLGEPGAELELIAVDVINFRQNLIVSVRSSVLSSRPLIP